MQSKCTILVPLLLWSTCNLTQGVLANPLGKVLELLEDLAAKVTKDGELEAKAYHEYFEWCDDTTKNVQFAIDTATSAKQKLEAKIGELSSDIAAADSKIEKLVAAIASAESSLKDAVEIRKKEHVDFAASEGELMDAVDTLGRAISIIGKEMAKNPAALAQVDSKSMTSALQALSVVLDAAAFTSKDQAKLTAFVQSQQEDDADDLELGAPAVAAYKSHSTGILDVLEDMKEKAEGQLSDLRKGEVNQQHNFNMAKQSLEDQLAADNKDMEEEKAAKAEAQEDKATAEGDLKNIVKDLETSLQQQATCRSSCLKVAADHQASIAARKEELTVMAKATKYLQETTSGAVSQTYSLVQVSQMRTERDLASSEVVDVVKQLAKRHHSAALAQLASRIATVLRFGSSGGDPFAKVKGLIQDMIAKLEREAGNEATEKAYCDEQMTKTKAKKSDLEDAISKQTARIDSASAKSAQLKEEVQELQSELGALAKEQAEMDRIRQESHADYEVAKSDLDLGLNGVRKALEVLRDYYGAGAALLQDGVSLGDAMQQPSAPVSHSKAAGAGGSIIDILEVVESDFATNLAKAETEEADAQSEYYKVSQENMVTKTAKEQDVKYKVQESKALDKTAAEYSADREGASTELEAVNEYYSKIQDRCIAKPEKYEDRKARRDAEIKGLKEALSILEDETALVQRKRHGSFRGTIAAM